MALIPTLFPLPVVPAIKRCGSFFKSVINALPTISFPSAMVSGDEDSLKSLESRSSRR